jgi:hypothetical protein
MQCDRPSGALLPRARLPLPGHRPPGPPRAAHGDWTGFIKKSPHVSAVFPQPLQLSKDGEDDEVATAGRQETICDAR